MGSLVLQGFLREKAEKSMVYAMPMAEVFVPPERE